MNSSDSTDNARIRSFPHLVRKEAVAALFALALLAVVSAVLDAPISGPAEPSGVPAADVKAPWIFVGIQQTLRYFPPFLAGVVLPFAAILTLALIPYCGDKNRKSVSLTFFSIVIVSLILTLWGYFW
jgi:quinol-cytochrome oxidoreductase complex cytochrome b subunit